MTVSKVALNNLLKGFNAPVESVVDLAEGTTPTTHALPIYDKAGNLIGYVPVYATPKLGE